MSSILQWQVWSSLIPALLHTLWIAAAVAVVLAALLLVIPASRSRLRYGLSLAALIAVAMGGLTAWAVVQHRSDSTMGGETGPGATVQAFAVVVAATQRPSNEVASPGRGEIRAFGESKVADFFGAQSWQAWLGILWLLGVVVMLLRFGSAMVASNKLREGGQLLVGGVKLASAFVDLREQLQVKVEVALRVSDEVLVPAVVGIVRPVILWPASWIGGLSGDQLRVVLAHELAHVRRHDYLLNLLQMLVEALLFFHPAVWWIGRRIRAEREACCDAAAARVIGGGFNVAECLGQLVGKIPGAEGRGRRVDHGQVVDLPGTVVALGDGRPGLGERVRRLLEPAHRPGLRLPWPTLLLVTVAFFGMIQLVGTGVELAVGALLDGPQHVAAVQEIEQEFDQSDRAAGESYSGDHRVTVAAVVRTYDGGPIPLKNLVNVISKSSGSTSSHSDSLWKNGTFRLQSVQPGSVTLGIKADGYAPAVLGPKRLRPGERWEDLKVELSEGFSMQMVIRDEAGRALPQVAVELFLRVGDWRSQNWLLKSGGDGSIAIPHLIEGSLTASIRAPGFQPAYEQIETLADGAFPVTLLKALPVGMTVTDAVSGDPITRASARILNGPPGTAHDDPRYEWIQEKPPEARSDDEGNLSLTSLRHGFFHSVWVEKPGYQPEIFYDVVVGDEMRQVTLRPQIEISVKLLGPLDQLKNRRSGELELSYSQDLKTSEEMSSGYRGVVSVREENGSGIALLDQRILPGRLTILAPFGPVFVAATEEAAEVVIDLRAERSVDAVDAEEEDELTGTAAAPSKRKVILRLVPPEGWPTPEGEVTLGFLSISGKGHRYESFPKELKAGEARIEVPINASEGKGTFTSQQLMASGFWMEDLSGVDIEAGERPKVIEAKVYPAGAIYGRVVDESGEPVAGAGISMTILEEPEGSPRPDSNWWNNRPADADGRFMISPVPLGRVYQAECMDGPGASESRFYSEPIRIDERRSRREITMTLPRGEDLRVQVVDEKGRAVPGAHVALNYESKTGGMSQSPKVADGEGRVVFRGVNFELSVDYYLLAQPSPNLAASRAFVDADDREVKVVMKPGQRLEGVLIDEDTDQPLSGRWVHVSGVSPDAASRERIGVRTDRDGRFVFRNLEAVRYLFSVENTVGPVQFVTLPRDKNASPLEVRVELRR